MLHVYPSRYANPMIFSDKDTFWVGQPSLELACHFGLVLAVEIAIFVPLGPWISAWKGPKWPKVSLSHALDTFWVGRPNLEQACHFGLVLAVEIAIFEPLGPWIGAWKGPKWP